MHHGQRFDETIFQQKVVKKAGNKYRRKKTGKKTDGQSNGKPFNGPGTKLKQKESGNQWRDMWIKDRWPGTAITGTDRGAQRPAIINFFTGTLINKHVSINRHAQGQNNTRDTGQGQRHLWVRHENIKQAHAS